MAKNKRNNRTSLAPKEHLGEPLTDEGPGWEIRQPAYEVTCWAPGKHRNEWVLSVDANLHEPAETTCCIWLCGSFLTGKSLTEVLPALGILEPEDRYDVIAVLIQKLGHVKREEPPAITTTSKKGTEQ